LASRPIALATCARFPALYAEEAELPARFAAAGVPCEPAIWNAPEVDWSRFRAVVLRSVWDYFERPDEFHAWCDRLERLGVAVVNPLALVRWNQDKRYLAELAAKGVRTLPTAFFARGSQPDLAAEIARRGWGEVVLKPSVSGGAYRTYRIPAGSAASFAPQLAEILGVCAAMVQPFAPEILTDGEWSLFFFGGAFSHALVKRPAAGDFRSQPLLGASATAAEPAPAAIDEARRILELLPAPATYARIDGIHVQGRFHLMEVEAIEPYLFTAGRAGALDRYVACVIAALPGPERARRPA